MEKDKTDKKTQTKTKHAKKAFFIEPKKKAVRRAEVRCRVKTSVKRSHAKAVGTWS